MFPRDNCDGELNTCDAVPTLYAIMLDQASIPAPAISATVEMGRNARTRTAVPASHAMVTTAACYSATCTMMNLLQRRASPVTRVWSTSTVMASHVATSTILRTIHAGCRSRMMHALTGAETYSCTCNTGYAIRLRVHQWVHFKCRSVLATCEIVVDEDP